MNNHWRDPKFAYQGAATHNDASAFRRRQQERRRKAEAEAAAVKVGKVQPIKRKAAQ